MGLLLIARDNIRRKKGNTFLFFLLVALSVLLLYVGISVVTNIDNVIDSRNAHVNGADYLLFTGSSHTQEIAEILKEQKETAYMEREKALYATGAKFYKEGEKAADADQLEFFFFEKDAARKLSVIQIIDEGKEWNDNSVLLPYYMKTGMGYETGDVLCVDYKNQVYQFQVYGFTEDVMFATPNNLPAVKCFISADAFAAYSDAWDKDMAYRVKLDKGYDTAEFSDKMQDVLSADIADYQQVLNWTLDYSTMRTGTGVAANIFMGILTAFAVLLVLISLVIVRFNIRNAIEMNIRNIGMLKACGYTGSQLRRASMLEYLLTGLLGIGAGLAIAQSASGIVGNIISASLGLQWDMGADIRSAAISTAAVMVLILAAVYISCRKYKKITPLDAMRNGMHSHNFKRNHVPLSTTHLPLHAAVGMKHVLLDRRRTLAFGGIVALLSFCAQMSFGIYDNYAVQDRKLIEVTGFETPDITTAVKEADPKKAEVLQAELEDKLYAVDGISHIVAYTADDVTCTYKGGKEGVNCDAYDDTEHLRIDNVVEGRRPKLDNEVMLSTVIADRLGAGTGDVVYLKLGGSRQDYLVTGLSQGMNHLGKKAMVTKEGFARIKPDIVPELYIYLDEDKDVPSMVNEIKGIVKGKDVTVTNFLDYISVSLGSIKSVMKVLCIVMFGAVNLVIALILILLVKTQIVREQRQLGIYKALGCTTRQLILQTTMSYIPVVLSGALFGSAAAWFGTEPSLILCFSAFGIKKCGLDMNIGAMAAIVAAIVLWAWLAAVVWSMRIRKIEPCRMIEEV
ncbi:ABC transporter permease [Dorea sp. D27]|uniref:ABC transporter permease n=1 Tax=Dorea sp. D27 TaxID=658665 RepID=UPI000673B406|nr:ABC transporter permease [Dorea sp. D27]KMZ53905.1 efflux ABC transporter, permease protein [Dorea sp. D27]